MKLPLGICIKVTEIKGKNDIKCIENEVLKFVIDYIKTCKLCYTECREFYKSLTILRTELPNK